MAAAAGAHQNKASKIMVQGRGAKPADLEDEARFGPGLSVEQRLAFLNTSRIASGDRNISTAGRIVSLWKSGATVEVMFPTRGPSVVMLFDHRSDQIYECEVRWRTDEHIGVRFLDILGAGRRRLFFADQPVPLRTLPNQILKLAVRPREDFAAGRTEPPWRMTETPPAAAPFAPAKSGRGALGQRAT